MKITVEIERRTKVPCVVEIYFDEEGFDFLLERLSLIRNKKTDHVHFFTPSWGGEELSEEKICRYSNDIAHHLKLTMVQPPVPPLRIAVEIEKESKSKVPCAVEIYFNEEGFDSLLKKLSSIRDEITDHVHFFSPSLDAHRNVLGFITDHVNFFTPSWGGDDLSEGELFCYSNDRAHCLKLTMLQTPPPPPESLWNYWIRCYKRWKARLIYYNVEALREWMFKFFIRK